MSEDQYTPPGQQQPTEQSGASSQPENATQAVTAPPQQAAPPPVMEENLTIAEVRSTVAKEMTKDGRYIPYGGGLMGWFENTGVLKTEEKNGYKFHTVVDVDSVREKLFERWGNTDTLNRRVVKREKVDDLDIKTTLITGSAEFLATTMDFSVHGLRLQMIQEEVPLKKGDKLNVRLYSDVERNDLAFDLPANIMWINRTGRRRPIWQLGLNFDSLSFEKSQELKEFFAKN